MLKVKWWIKIYKAKGSKKTSGVGILILGEDIYLKRIQWDKERHFIMLKAKCYHED